MGCFSYIKADYSTKVANIVYDAPFKFLIPKEFGFNEGFIKDHYQGYGKVGTRTVAEARGCKVYYDLSQYNDTDLVPKYDMYELLAVWNFSLFKDKLKGIHNPDNSINYMKEIDENTKYNRSLGIELFFSEKYFDSNIYSLKLVSSSYKGTYESCKGVSISDPNQGCGKLKWKDFESKYPDVFDKIKKFFEHEMREKFSKELSTKDISITASIKTKPINLDSINLSQYTIEELIKLNKRICDILYKAYK